MEAKGGERWKELCAQAAVEKDPERLINLVNEINELLQAKERSQLEPKPPVIAQLLPTTAPKSERKKA